ALDEVQLRGLGIADTAVGELPRQRRAGERALAADVARLASRLARVPRRDRLVDDLPRLARVLLEELHQLRVDGALHHPVDPRVPELRLRLALELRLAQLHRDDRGEALADVLALEVRLLLLQERRVRAARVPVQRAGERAAEPREVRAALVRVDVVRERVDG